MADDFKQYTDIENVSNAGFIEEIRGTLGSGRIAWVVMEKIHGANFQAYYDGSTLRFGKRTSYLNGMEGFYSYLSAVPEGLEGKIREIYEDYSQPIRIFGELFGGKYLAEHGHRDEVKRLCPKCVQREVQYSPLNHVLFYDMEIGGRKLSWKEIESLVRKYGLGPGNIQFEQPVKIVEATLDEIIKEDNAFDSRIWNTDLAFEQLPHIADNICEGIVIKPYAEELRTGRNNRIILKSKNEKFRERKREKKPEDPEEKKLTMSIAAPLLPYVNMNRFNAVYSKDSWTRKDLGRFLKCYMEDILKDARKDGIVLPEDEKVMRQVRKLLNSELIRSKDEFFSRTYVAEQQ